MLERPNVSSKIESSAAEDTSVKVLPKIGEMCVKFVEVLLIVLMHVGRPKGKGCCSRCQ